MKKAVIILSGGLDSACMMSYLKKGYQLYGVTFAYGQRASQEIKAAKRIVKLLKLKEHKILDIGFMKNLYGCLLYTSPSPRDGLLSRMPSSA